MKKMRSLLAMIMIALMCVPTVAIAEETTNIQYDIRAIMSEELVPKMTTINYSYDLPSDVLIENYDHAIEKVNSDGIAMRIDFSMMASEDYSDEDWQNVAYWLDELTNISIQGIAVDTESMAKVLAGAIDKARRAYVAAEGTETPAWARESLMVNCISVTIPYYPQLSSGINGSATQNLQEKLIQYGFLTDKADGYFGNNTKVAVELLENYVRELEQDVIDAEYALSAAPTAAPDPTQAPTLAPTTTSLTLALPEAETTDAPNESANDESIDSETTSDPKPVPETPVDGIADALLQAYLYSDEFQAARCELTMDAQGIDVSRLQNRLSVLGYMNDPADGYYGVSTARSVRIFQYYNGLEVDGVADVTTQQLLYSKDAKQPDNSMLSAGSKGDDVKTLQQRLRVLGFMNASADGDYGNNTTIGVKNLQEYMRGLEEDSIRADAQAMAQLESSGSDISSMLTIDVNGIADPMLLEDFYSESFPSIPAEMSSGSSGGDVVRLQRRLSGLEYYYGSLDGKYGAGTVSAVQDFQKQHKLEQTGVADVATMQVLFSDNAQKALKPYVLKVSIDDQRVYAYGLDSNNEYTDLVRTMKCSTGLNDTPTPKGTFVSTTGPGARWHYFKKFDCWAQYAYYIEGDIMFHSVLYDEQGSGLRQSSVNNLGKKASHGCVRLSVDDAKWIWQNCPKTTKIIVY